MSFDKEESDGNVDPGLGLDLGPRIKTVSREYRVEAGGQVMTKMIIIKRYGWVHKMGTKNLSWDFVEYI